jgi:hypothetical protein
MDENTFRIAQMLVPEMPLPSFWRQSAPYFPPSNPTPSPAPSTRMGQWATEWQTPTSQPMEPTFGQSATAALLTAMSAMPAGRGLPGPRMSLVPTTGGIKAHSGFEYLPGRHAHNYRIMSGDTDLGGISLNVKNPQAPEVQMIENWGGGGPNSLGPSVLREILGLLRQQYPQMTKLHGLRISGARDAANVRDPYAEINFPTGK